MEHGNSGWISLGLAIYPYNRIQIVSYRTIQVAVTQSTLLHRSPSHIRCGTIHKLSLRFCMLLDYVPHQQGRINSRKGLGSKSCSAITKSSLLASVCPAQIQSTPSYLTLRRNLTLPEPKPAHYKNPRSIEHFVREPSNFIQISQELILRFCLALRCCSIWVNTTYKNTPCVQMIPQNPQETATAKILTIAGTETCFYFY